MVSTPCARKPARTHTQRNARACSRLPLLSQCAHVFCVVCGVLFDACWSFGPIYEARSKQQHVQCVHCALVGMFEVRGSKNKAATTTTAPKVLASPLRRRCGRAAVAATAATAGRATCGVVDASAECWCVFKSSASTNVLGVCGARGRRFARVLGKLIDGGAGSGGGECVCRGKRRERGGWGSSK